MLRYIFIKLYIHYSVADCKATKMNTENLAKIFGPTVLGYSSADPDQHEIFAETMIQRDVSFAQNLLKICNYAWFAQSQNRL